MSARWWSLGVWALAAASALYWGFKLFATAQPLPPNTQLAAPVMLAQGDVSRVLGVDAPPPVAAAAAEPPPDARFQLLGVVAPRGKHAGGEGVALIAVDGKPAKAFRVGALVEGQNVLQAVAARGATLGPRGGAATVALNLNPVPPAATGNLPPAGAAPGGAPMPPQVPGVPGPPGAFVTPPGATRLPGAMPPQSRRQLQQQAQQFPQAVPDNADGLPPGVPNGGLPTQ